MKPQDMIAVPQQDTAAEVAAAGRDAITARLNALYQGRKPKHYENPHPWEQGGPDPLAGISVWQRAEPVPHWHYVTYGFSEQHAKPGKNPGLSGYGFELTFRLATTAAQQDEPPIWPIHLLQNLGRYVFRSGNGFNDGDRLDAGGPIAHGSTTQLCALGFAFDGELETIDTPNGKVTFLQVVGLTQDEELAAQKWDTRKVMGMMLPYMPLWITNLQRSSMMAFPAIQAKVADGIRKDGSSSGVVFTDLLDITETKRFLRQSQVNMVLGARLVQQLTELFPLRLGYGKPFALCGPEWRLHFEVAKGKKNSWRVEHGVIRFFVARATVQEFATLLHARQGVYKLPSFQNILWDVRQTTIRNAEGEIVDIIG
jgi:suppressor of fused